MEIKELNEELKEILTEESVVVSDQVAEWARQSINNLDNILNTLKEFGEGDMEDIESLENAIEVLRNMIPELQ